MKRKFEDQNEEILRCRRQVRFWSERLEQLEAERRRAGLMVETHCIQTRLRRENVIFSDAPVRDCVLDSP
jgi:hypothetical protein